MREPMQVPIAERNQAPTMEVIEKDFSAWLVVEKPQDLGGRIRIAHAQHIANIRCLLLIDRSPGQKFSHHFDAAFEI